MTHPNSDDAKSLLQNPFQSMDIADNSILDTINGRYICGNCFKSRKFFCYTCFTPHPELEKTIPKVKLPIKVDIIKHKREIDGKSTAAHAAILAQEDIRVYTYPDIPSYDNEKVVLIFPSHTALEIPQLFENTKSDLNQIQSDFDYECPKGIHKTTLLTSIPASYSKNDCDINFVESTELPITKAVFIDSTWNQSKGIYKDERIRKLPCVVLQNRISQFWRHQKGSPRWYLATVEAIHQFVVEVHLNAWGYKADYAGLNCCFTENSLEKYQKLVSNSQRAYSGQYDNLLYFFQHMYKLIHTYYDHDNLYAYKRRML
ncbi:PREDICTED: DTW domain-containing protein 1 [Nicrophorus vespilloides]|uniref:tRNA-uridine aminocarboxypropyltransferase 1 n=1 Tax=Nicrophorus vespilloides TaxID=110193 RepID=A0ABM1MGW4_NICVS|nr:PREDICTED: DTW domain-containing protein 1 [Nicrophorus vespilloides]